MTRWVWIFSTLAGFLVGMAVFMATMIACHLMAWYRDQ